MYLDTRLEAYGALVTHLTDLYTNILIYLAKAMRYYNSGFASGFYPHKMEVKKLNTKFQIPTGRLMKDSAQFTSMLKDIVDKQEEVDRFAHIVITESSCYFHLKFFLSDFTFKVKSRGNLSEMAFYPCSSSYKPKRDPRHTARAY